MARHGSKEWKLKLSRAAKGIRRSPATEFKKGHVAWNKGMKGIRNSPATEFKKGVLRGQAARRYRAIGTIAIRRDKNGMQTRWIKVHADGPPQYRFVPLARYWYELRVGPVPLGHFVVHRDGDTMNDAMSNLLLVDRSRLLAWKKSIRPAMEDRRKANSRKTTQLRFRIHRFRREQAEKHKQWSA